jgi:hypothetical protein
MKERAHTIHNLTATIHNRHDIMVMFITMVDDPNHHARVQSSRRQTHYADLTRPEQNVLRTPPRYSSGCTQ